MGTRAIALLVLIAMPVLAQAQTHASGDLRPIERSWNFVVAGDSRNCGDLVMPAIARQTKADGAEFYWHLGDFRWLKQPDEDMTKNGGEPPKNYPAIAWQDFIDHQLSPFAALSIPVFLGIGNHELIGKTRDDYTATFAKWIDTDLLRKQRSAECKQGPCPVQTYYDWTRHRVNFISLDNASAEGFDLLQIRWLEEVLERDRNDKNITAVVVGMHRALPNSWSCAHSMNGDKKNENHPAVQASIVSGRYAYKLMRNFVEESGKHLYVVASHSHLYMPAIFDTDYWRARDKNHEVLPGLIVGTAGAKQYGLPLDLPEPISRAARNRIYGYVLARVSPDGQISFEFQELTKEGILETAGGRFDSYVIDYCFGTTRDQNLAGHWVGDPPDSCLEK